MYFVLFHFYLSLNHCFPSAYNSSAAGINKDLSHCYIMFASIFWGGYQFFVTIMCSYSNYSRNTYLIN